MNNFENLQLSRRLFVNSALSVLAFPSALAFGDSCRGPQAEPEGDYPRSLFGETSTAEEVTAGLDLNGTTAVITGCNSGLGYESMRVLASRGAHVIGTARTIEKAQAACSTIDGKTTPQVLELGNLDSVRSCTESIKAMGLPLDTLICNAGIMALPDLQLVNGIERQFAINHLGHFLFTNQLVDAVIAAPKGRIVIVSSCAHFGAPKVGIDFDNLDGSKSYAPWVAYGRSKLANGLFAAELSRRLSGTAVTANSLHPGVIKTNLARHLPDRDSDVDEKDIFNKSIPEGAATQCYLAAHPTPASISGQYFSDCNPAQANPLMYDQELAGKLWDVSLKLTS
jgi:NAD(P)-dependent dehydrogenase (short-subunit alcohol dehydrogenase family)